MLITYNQEKLQRIIEDIFILTGISISILDTKYNLISTTQKQEFCSLLHDIESESQQCASCDSILLGKCSSSGKLERHICRAGLYDCAMPIIKHNTIIAYIIMGQIRSGDSPSELKYVPDAPSKITEKLKKLYKQTSFLTGEQLFGLYDLLPHIIFNDAIEIVYDPFVNEAINFIEENLESKISINTLCNKFHVSKNYLYESFKTNLNNTVTGYINEIRIRTAKALLDQTNLSVYQIAEKVGVENYTYFCKLFKKLSGVTPTQYRTKP